MRLEHLCEEDLSFILSCSTARINTERLTNAFRLSLQLVFFFASWRSPPRVVLEGGHRLTKLNDLFVRVAVIVASALRMLMCMAMRVVEPYRILWAHSWSQAANHTAHTIRDAAQNGFSLSSMGVGSRWGSSVLMVPAARVVLVCVPVPVVVRFSSLFIVCFSSLLFCNLLQHLEILALFRRYLALPNRNMAIVVYPSRFQPPRRFGFFVCDFDEAPTTL